VRHWFDELGKAFAAETSRRRAFKLAIAGVAGTMLGQRLQNSAEAQSNRISYPAGWNLVSGPPGSTLVGATGNILTWRPGDAAYETFPANGLLSGCWGYWAYFPNGGSLVPGTDLVTCSTPSSAGQWVMVGNPSATAVATATAQRLFTYAPSSGTYQASSTLQPGAGAWAMDPALVLVSVPAAVATPIAAPVYQPVAQPISYPTPQPVYTQPSYTPPITSQPVSSPAASACCKTCSSGQPCGGSCISASSTCHAGPGCAC
jgi:hypothetical protein